MKTFFSLLFIVISSRLFCQLNLELSFTDFSGLTDTSYVIYTLSSEQIENELLPQFTTLYNSPDFLDELESTYTIFLSQLLLDHSSMGGISLDEWDEMAKGYSKSIRKKFKEVKSVYQSLNQIYLENCEVLDTRNGGYFIGYYSQIVKLEVSNNGRKALFELFILSEELDFKKSLLYMHVL